MAAGSLLRRQLFGARLVRAFLRESAVLVLGPLGVAVLADVGLLVTFVIGLLLVAGGLGMQLVRRLVDALGDLFEILRTGRAVLRFRLGVTLVALRHVARLHVGSSLRLAGMRLGTFRRLLLLGAIGIATGGVGRLGAVLAVLLAALGLALCCGRLLGRLGVFLLPLVLTAVPLRRVLRLNAAFALLTFILLVAGV